MLQNNCGATGILYAQQGKALTLTVSEVKIFVEFFGSFVCLFWRFVGWLVVFGFFGVLGFFFFLLL